ncbi:hypothetical protein TW81_06465 [Vibrio galatheae]|uniref:Uncharacterized protein n=1 Tax=Vibrio galatheae TaxID=579748 RepID=A0A0F4NM91_9VIBR|nr:hypothetical protein [Vibrio galatheae]KJY83963.1 hypothetical protein TW81_06465 [Vibrio galatheae]
MKIVSGLMILTCSQAIAGGVSDERLIASLIKQGVICQNQSDVEKQKSLQIYLSKKFSEPSEKKSTNESPELEQPDCISAKE